MIGSSIIVYLFVISISTGLFFNALGEKSILLLLGLVFLSRNKVRISYKVLISALGMAMFVMIKAILGDLTISNDYHGIWPVYVKMIELVVVFIIFSALKQDVLLHSDTFIKHCKFLFHVCYYTTLIITIFFLMKNGIGYYRTNELTSIIYAPQFFLYYAMIFSVELLSQIFTKNRGIVQILLALVINILFIIMMNYTTQIMFLIFGLFMISIVKIANKKWKVFLCIMGCIILLFIIFPYASCFLNLINEKFFSSNKDISMRLKEISYFLSTGELSGAALGGRIRIMKISFSTFVNNPLFGVSFKNYNMNGLMVGGHYEWVDDLARFGIIGTVLLVVFAYTGFKYGIVGQKKGDDVYKVLMIVFIIYGFFNPFLNIMFVMPCFLWSWLVSSPWEKGKDASVVNMKKLSRL